MRKKPGNERASASRGSAGTRPGEDRFHQDGLRELFADGEPGIADLTDEVVAARDEADDLIFAEAEFAEAILNFRRGAELLDADRNACLNAAQGTNFAMRLIAGVWLALFVAHGQYSGSSGA